MLHLNHRGWMCALTSLHDYIYFEHNTVTKLAGKRDQTRKHEASY